MATCVLSDTLTDVSGNVMPLVEVIVRVQNFAVANRAVNAPKKVRTNQQGVFTVNLIQGSLVRVIIRDLGVDIAVTVPATPTTDLATLMV